MYNECYQENHRTTYLAIYLLLGVEHTVWSPGGGTSTPRRWWSPPARASPPSSWPGPGQQGAHYNTLVSVVLFVLTEGNIHDPLVLINHLIMSDYVVQEPHSLWWLDNWRSNRVQRHRNYAHVSYVRGRSQPFLINQNFFSNLGTVQVLRCSFYTHFRPLVGRAVRIIMLYFRF